MATQDEEIARYLREAARLSALQQKIALRLEALRNHRSL